MNARLLKFALVVGAVMTFAGFLAPIYPPAEMPNHLRPFTLAGFTVLLGLAIWLNAKSIARLCAILVCVNGALIALALQPQVALATPQSAGRHLELITFNVWSKNKNLDQVAAWLLAQDADIVVLQEISDQNRPFFNGALSKTYGHIYDCGCNELLIASKSAWVDAGGQGRTDDVPSMSWLRFPDGKGGSYRLVSLRPIYPKHPSQQARHYAWMDREFQNTSRTSILVGDFNLTPWSYKLQHFASESGLRRHGTWASSWSADVGGGFLIDNVFSTPDVTSISFKTGPNLGSDHFPIIAELVLP